MKQRPIVRPAKTEIFVGDRRLEDLSPAERGALGQRVAQAMVPALAYYADLEWQRQRGVGK